MNTTPPTTTGPATAILTQYLANNDAPCPRCRYNLRNLTTNQCPECGLELALQVKGTQPIVKWWIVTLLAHTIPVGFHLFLFSAVIIHQFSIWATWDDEMLIPLIFAPFTVIIISALVWKRRLFLLLNPKLQCTAAIASLILQPTVLALFFYLVTP